MKSLYAVLFLLVSFQLSGAPPTVPATNLSFNIIDGGYFNLGWTAGNGARRIIVCKAGGPVSFVPQNGVDYTESTIFGNGQQVAAGEFIVYDHFATSFYLTGLSAATTYHFRVYEYNGTGASIEYLTSAYLSGSATTSAPPTTQTSNATFSNITINSVNINWTSGNGFRRLIVAREGAPVNADPVNGQSYAVNYMFGNGAATGPGNYTVYNNTGTGTNIANLQPGREYFFAFYEFNGSGQPQYKYPAYTTSITTRSVPTIASSNPIITKADGKELFLTWTNGNGQRRIVVAKQGSNILSTPTNGVDYAANQVFGTGQQLGTGEFVVYDDNFNAAQISGLQPGTTYNFKIFEYDGTGSNTAYLTSAFASINGTTVTTPMVQTSNLSVSNTTSNSLRLHFTPGDGRARMIIGRKSSPVSVVPVNFTVYDGNTDFGAGQDLGSGNYALSNTTEILATILNLEPNTTYHFALFEFNGFNQPLYLAPSATFSATTLGALPVKLSRWEAVPEQTKVSLQWTTSSEINASHFMIERSQDGVSFSGIANITATGSSSTDVHYNHYDNSPLPGKSYYRLKMVDIDGHTEYSAIRTVVFNENQDLALISNPVQDSLQFVIPSADNGTRCQWQIINVAGQAVKKGITGSYRTEVSMSGVPSGTYWLQLHINGRIKTLAFVKQ